MVVDSGSTKASWAVSDAKGTIQVLAETEGINPVHQSDEQIVATMKSVPFSTNDIYYYGSGVTVDQQDRMHRLLSQAFPTATHIEAHSDMLGAARALCQHSAGMACILGTGSNSCLYDGESITANTPPLGYILGDEGSGAVLGRLLIGALYKHQLPHSLRLAFEQEMQLTLPEIIERVYRQPLPNRFLASLCPFMAAHMAQVPQLETLVYQAFQRFVQRNLDPYNRKDLPVGAVGSIAWHFREPFTRALQSQGYQVGQVMAKPIEGMAKYHLIIKN